MLSNRAEFISYKQQAEKDYAAQKKKIIIIVAIFMRASIVMKRRSISVW